VADYDIVTVGGGVGGAVLATAMAGHGARVLVVERETRFTDRVRGEFIFPWGVAEAQSLGVYDTLIEAGGHHPRYWADHLGPEPLPPRDFAEDTPLGLRGLCIYHPRMQDVLLRAAFAAGVEVRCGTRVREVRPGREPRVVVDAAGRHVAITARLVIGADGRSSRVRNWGGFRARHDRPGNRFTGVLVDGVGASPESSICMLNPSLSRMALYFPQTADSGRAYLASRSEEDVRFTRQVGFDRFLQECARSGFPPGVFDGARQAGPLATFDGADSWVQHPYASGIALIGDAAATSDPTWGQGLSLTLRDARTLRDALLAHEDWDAAGHAYAAAHDRDYRAVRTTNGWFTQVWLQPGPDAEALRARVLPQLETDPLLLPDTMVAGPDSAPPTDAHRVKIFGPLVSSDLPHT
jgi:menaquinone-9 beta-reductase